MSHDRTVRAGSPVTITGIWTTQSQIVAGPSSPANLIALSPGLYAGRPLGSSVQQLNVAPVLAQAKQLIGAFNIGSPQVRLSNVVGLSPGSLLIIDGPDADRSEIVAINTIIDPGSGPDEPATAVLAQALLRNHPDGTAVYPASAGAPGASNSLTRAAQAGDITVFPGTMTGLDLTMLSVMITGGAALAEYQWAQVYQVTSDADGYFRLPPIHRVAQIDLHATNGAEPLPLDLPVALDWGRDALVLDLVFPP
jgi:hypothetical protein